MQNLCARAHVHKAQAQGAGSLSGGQIQKEIGRPRASALRASTQGTTKGTSHAAGTAEGLRNYKTLN